MGLGTVIVVSVATFVVLGGLRRAFWFRRHARGGYGRRRMGGWFMERFLDEVGVSGEQKSQVRSIREKLGDGLSALRGPRRELISKVLDRMAQDELDAEAIDLAAEELLGKARSEIRKALVELHAALTPEQRKKAVELARRRLGRFAEA